MTVSIGSLDPLSARFELGTPLVERAEGPWLWTTDGRRLVDHLLGNCVQVLGHSNPHVVAALRGQAGQAVNVGDGLHQLTEPLARRILRHADKDALRFVNSGSEGVHLALRVARAHTRRPKVVKFSGHYHGWLTEQIARFVPEPYTTGLPPDAGEALITVPWNDAAALRAAFERQGEEVAALICEPILCHAGPIEPLPGFLELARELCDQSGAMLIFDECITGFRVALGGAQERFGVKSDLVVYAKALSGGMPLGVCCGTAAPMAELGEPGVFQAGTFDGNPMSLAAAAAVLDQLEETDALARIATATDRLAAAMARILSERSIPHLIRNVPGTAMFYFTEEAEIADADAAINRTDIGRYARLVDRLREEGVYLVPGDVRENRRRSWLSQWFLSATHDEEALAASTEALSRALDAEER